ncbi:MAG: hypothetical protein LLG06_18690 [Desulfobacteraceae bacterium]|nr:hypothetical protein [Desulfobacteraceae bacterium]
MTIKQSLSIMLVLFAVVLSNAPQDQTSRDRDRSGAYTSGSYDSRAVTPQRDYDFGAGDRASNYPPYHHPSH